MIRYQLFSKTLAVAGMNFKTHSGSKKHWTEYDRHQCCEMI